jgi:hypothetical protein
LAIAEAERQQWSEGEEKKKLKNEGKMHEQATSLQGLFVEQLKQNDFMFFSGRKKLS